MNESLVIDILSKPLKSLSEYVLSTDNTLKMSNLVIYDRDNTGLFTIEHYKKEEDFVIDFSFLTDGTGIKVFKEEGFSFDHTRLFDLIGDIFVALNEFDFPVIKLDFLVRSDGYTNVTIDGDIEKIIYIW